MFYIYEKNFELFSIPDKIKNLFYCNFIFIFLLMLSVYFLYQAVKLKKYEKKLFNIVGFNIFLFTILIVNIISKFDFWKDFSWPQLMLIIFFIGIIIYPEIIMVFCANLLKNKTGFKETMPINNYYINSANLKIPKDELDNISEMLDKNLTYKENFTINKK